VLRKSRVLTRKLRKREIMVKLISKIQRSKMINKQYLSKTHRKMIKMKKLKNKR